MNDTLLTVENIMSLLNIGRSTTYKLIKNGQLPGKKLGKRIYVKKTDIDKFIKQYFS